MNYNLEEPQNGLHKYPTVPPYDLEVKLTYLALYVMDIDQITQNIDVCVWGEFNVACKINSNKNYKSIRPWVFIL